MCWTTSVVTPTAWRLSNDRIVPSSNGEVTFAYRDRKNQDRRKLMKLDAEEFIRRFLLHVIPKGFMRVRHYGFLANHCKDVLSKCRQLLGLTPAPPPSPQRSTDELMLALTGIDITRYQLCRTELWSGFANWQCPPWISRERIYQSMRRSFPCSVPEPNAELCPVVSFCLLLAHAQWYLAVYLPKPISVNTTRIIRQSPVEHGQLASMLPFQSP